MAGVQWAPTGMEYCFSRAVRAQLLLRAYESNQTPSIYLLKSFNPSHVPREVPFPIYKYHLLVSTVLELRHMPASDASYLPTLHTFTCPPQSEIRNKVSDRS